MRPRQCDPLEILSKMACPSPSATQSVKRLCNGLVQGSALVAHAQVWLSQLESQTVDQRSVVKELQNLHHELSRDHHYVDMTKSSLRSGELPLRAAVALAILEAQRLLANTPAGTLPHEDVFYTDENGQQLHVLHNSTVV
ncbi:hypothetical protein BASA81_007596 [Batrachochytrium salamandrivorans]|nr:hypothetical protein BASA81_007596 [Batrachochytrium salamandrivorans]